MVYKKKIKEKVCLECKEILPISDFRILNRLLNTSNLSKNCKTCINEKALNTRRTNTSDQFYLYRFINNENEIIYVGQTRNFNYRLAQHKSMGVIDNFDEEVSRIEYVKFNSEYRVKIYEIHYIVKLKPEYNKEFVNDKTTEFFDLPELEWMQFYEKFHIRWHLQTKLGMSKKEIAVFMRDEEKLSALIKTLENGG